MPVSILRLTVLGVALAVAVPAIAQEAEPTPTTFPIKEPEPQHWTFSGPFGKFDEGQLQRGYQVYKEVCANCHSMRLVAFRTLAQKGGPGFTDAQVKELAASFKDIPDGPNDQGEMFKRPGRPSDYFPSPYPNDQASAAALGASPPDLSMIAKARGVERGPLLTVVDFFTQYQEGGPDYIHALLTGYQDPPPGFKVPAGTHYNPYFNAAPSLAMPPPLADGAVPYTDGSPQTVDQYSRDVAAFLMWAAEPHLVERKRMGFMAFIFLVVFAGLMLVTKRKVWANVAH